MIPVLKDKASHPRQRPGCWFRWAAWIGATLLPLVPPSLGSVADVEGLLREAYRESPALKAAFARWEAAEAAVEQAGALPDPRVGYSHFIRQMNTRQLFRIEQQFPGWGKRGLRASAASQAARAAGERLESLAADTRRDLLTALTEWILSGRSAELVAENLRLVEKLERVALQRYRAGEVSQADVLRLQMEAEVLRVDLAGWREREPARRAAVNALLGRVPGSDLPEISQFPEALVSQPSGLVGEPGSVENNPDLRQLRSRIREAEDEQMLARRTSVPDINVSLEFMDNRHGLRDEVMAMVSFNIPWWRGRYEAQRRQAGALLRAAEQDYAGARLALNAQVEDARFASEDATRRVRLFEETLLPRAEQALEILEADYQTGRAAFLDLLEAQRAVLDLRLALLRAQADQFLRRLEWERLAGPFLPLIEFEEHHDEKK